MFFLQIMKERDVFYNTYIEKYERQGVKDDDFLQTMRGKGMCFTIYIEKSMKDRELKLMIFTNNEKEMCFFTIYTDKYERK